MLGHVRRGDTLVVWKLDRLGRSMAHLIETVRKLETKGVSFRSLTEGVDTTTPGGTLVFHIFSALARAYEHGAEGRRGPRAQGRPEAGGDTRRAGASEDASCCQADGARGCRAGESRQDCAL